MTKKIFEELPARKHAVATAAPASAPSKGEGNVEGEGSDKKIRQAVYDIRYRARREGIDLKAAYSQYMSNSNLTAPEQSAVREKLFSKDGGGGSEDKKESYDSLMSDGATSAVANAMFKVFVENNIKEEVIQEDETSEKKYKVRVIDEKSGRSYVRYADREKITALRAKGLKVEMTEHGDPYEGKKKEGGKMDSVAKNPAKRDGDVNNDGKKDSTDKYIYNRRDAINAAIAKKKGMSEEFLVDGTTSTEGQNKGKITGEKVDNYKTGVVKVMKSVEESKSKKLFLDMIAEKKKSDKCVHTPEGEDCEVHGKIDCSNTVKEQVTNCGCGQNPCITYGESKEDKKEKESTPGERETYRTLLKNKLRAMGIKRPLIMDMEPGEEKTMKAMTASSAKLAATCEEVDERSPEANAAKQEAAKKAHHNSKKKRTPITSGGGTPDTQSADNEARRLGQNRMRQAGY
jgi:hypothetical protein